MGYFRELPELYYQSFLSNSNSSQNYLLVKNLFRRCKLRDDLQNVFTIFNKYEIVEGARPDTVAEEMYGSAELDWVVLMTAGIVNARDEWPLSDKEIYDYALDVYGNDLNDIHHYETKEIKDQNGKLILPKGKTVDSTFTIPDPDDYRLTINPITGISNYEYEVIKNNKKRSIYLLKPGYLQQFLNDMRQEMLYDKSSQYISEDLIATENTKSTMP